ncbi:hypothetical protein ACP70R_049141 [Stipagrostis hirtigluma subsp. patula]
MSSVVGFVGGAAAELHPVILAAVLDPSRAPCSPPFPIGGQPPASCGSPPLDARSSTAGGIEHQIWLLGGGPMWRRCTGERAPPYLSMAQRSVAAASGIVTTRP